MHRILFHIGNLPVYSYGAMISLAVLVTAILMSREASRQGIDPDYALEAIIAAVIGGLLGSRILYVLLNWEHYRGNWREIFFARFEGLTFYGAFLGGLLVVILWCRWRKIDFYKFVDLAAPYFILGYAFGRVGCFLNGCCYGRVSTVPWAVAIPTVDSLPRHPVQLYASAGALVIFTVLMLMRRFRPYTGFNLIALCAFYGMLRFTTEFFREEAIVWMGLTLAQLFSLGLTILSLAVLLYMFSVAPPKRKKRSLRK